MNKPFETMANESMQKQVAALAACGARSPAIAKELHMDTRTVERMLTMPEVKALIEEIGDDAVRSAKSKLKRRISDLADDIVDTIKYQLVKKKSVQAAALGLKVMGMDGGQESKATGNLVVYLPGQKPEPITIKGNKND